MVLLDFSSGFDARRLREALNRLKVASDVADAVRGLIAEVRAGGDAALAALTARFDRAEVPADRLRVPAAEMEAATAALPDADRAAMVAAIDAIRGYHEQCRPQDWTSPNLHGGEVGERFYPIRRVGLYIPGGHVPLVSTVLMTAVPARVAGCPEIAVCTPPQASATVAPAVLAALQLCGISEVYRVGGVQAIAGMALGTASLPAVDKVFGPGNAYVNEAKRQLFGTVGVDLLPGPSEVLVIADETANPAWAAADLLAQAEHGTGKEKIYLVTVSAAMREAIVAEMQRQRPSLRHAEAIAALLPERFLAMTVASATDAIAAANIIAPEHLELLVDAATESRYLDGITTAGALLVGHHTPTVFGGFAAGLSHTLPTDTTARFSAGIQTRDFLRRSSIVRYTPAACEQAAPVVEAFARMEQLDAHGASLRRRLEGQA